MIEDSIRKYREKGLPERSKSFGEQVSKCICGHGTVPGKSYCSKCEQLMRKDCD